jgi:CubicO group peptidase (beta-lactamase class C family)
MTSYQLDGTGPLSRRLVLGLLGSIPVAAGAAVATGGSARASTAGCGQPPPPPPQGLQPGGTYDQQLARLAAQDQFSGTVLLVYQDKPVLARAYGMADTDKGIPNRPDTIFALASVTKLFTAVAVIQLAGQGKVGLYQTLGSYLDGFPARIAGTVTVHQLLTHTSGMGDFLGSPAYQRQHLSWASAAEVMDGITAIVKQAPLLSTPGTQYSYSNSGYATLGAIVAQVSGQSYYDYTREHVFAPAGMTRSDFYTKPQWLTDPDIAHPCSSSAPGGKSPAPPGGQRTDVISEEDFIGNPAGNAFSTAPDMVRFARALTGGRLLSPVWAGLMTSGKVPLPPQRIPSQLNMTGYGPDIRIVSGRIVVGHTGGAAGEPPMIEIRSRRDQPEVASHSAHAQKSSNTFCLLARRPASCQARPYSPPPRRFATASRPPRSTHAAMSGENHGVMAISNPP